jgi:hypothetical protein
MTDALQTVESFVAPVVMISANGLLCLALYNRLASVVNRMRTINKERVDLLARLLGNAPPGTAEAGHLKKRIDMLDELGHQLFGRTRLLRDSLVCLLITVLCMLGCSLALGLASLQATFGLVALALFVVGVLVMLWGTVRAIQELCRSLEPLAFEHEQIERWMHDPNNVEQPLTE